MKRILLILLFAVFYTSVNAQCSITTTTNASALTCGTAPVSACGGILYIGNGTNAMSLNMDANLDLTCLGAIQFIVRNNATLDFDAGSNKDLQLGEGSSIVFESGSAIKSNNSCSASDLIKIGGSNIASCNGGSATYSFPQIVTQGGYSPINASASPSSICNSGSSTITATATPSAGATYRWYTAASGGTLLQSSSSNTYSTGTISNTTTYYVEAYYASASPAYATVRKAVTVTVLPIFSLTNVSATATTCTTAKTSQVTVSSSASALPVGTYTVTYSLSYNSYSTSYTASMSVTTAGTGQFTANLGIMGTNNSTTIRVTNLSSGGCSNSISSGNNSNTVNMYSPIKPNITSIYSDYPVCSTSKVQWQNDTFVSGYFLDVATTNTFAAGTYVPGYQDLNVGNVIAYDVTGLTPGTTYYYRVRNNNLGCGISENSDVKSFTTGGIAAPGSITGSATQCPSLAGQVYSTTAVAGANGYSWNVPSGWTITSGWNTTSITVTTGTVGGNVTVAATSPSGGCYSEAKVLAVTMNGATFTTSPSSPICSNVDITYTTQSGKTGYVWTISGSLGTDYTISAGGTTTNSITLKWLTTGSKTVAVNYSGACSASATNTVTVNAVPATPGTITQPTNKCAGSTGNTYSITAVSGATSYTWSVTGTGWAVTAGGTTRSATITIGSGVGTVSVTATNACGTSSASTTGNITPNTAPATPGTITQPANKCAGSTGNTFSISPVAGATSYNWSVTGTGWSVTAGGTTTSATITIGSGSGTVSVTATNACGTSSASATGSVAPTTAPATPGPITQPANICAGSTGNTFSISPVAGTTSYTWSVTGTGWAVTAGGTTTSATITIGSGVGTVSVTATNACGTSSASTTGNITPNTAPTITGISSPSALCSGGSLNPSAPAVTNNGSAVTASGWEISTTSGGSTYTALSLPYTVAYVDNGKNIRYYATNGCGRTNSNNVAITVNPSPTPTFTTAPQVQTCAGEHMTYTTQSGQSNYTWTVSGILNTDYRIIARGTSTNYDIVIEWLTAGSKTVTVNYTNSNGCNGAAAAIYTTNVTVLDRGRVNGGTHICKGSPLPTLTLRNDAGNAPYPDSSLVLIWQYSDDLNNATWNDIPGTSGQISYTPTAFPGAFRTYQVILKSGNCTKTSIESRINIDAFNAPTLGTTTYPTCSVATGSVVLTGLPSGNWTINQTGTTTATYTNTVANTISYTVVGLPAGTYTFTVKEGNCTSDASATLNMSQVANTWDGSKWSKTGDTTLPTAGDKIVFEGNYTVTSDISGCSCTVNSGNVIVNSGRTLTIKNEVIVNGGTLTFENNASLLQDVNTTVNTNLGPIIYKRNSQPMKNFDFTYWSSPVEGQTLYNLSPNTLWDKYQSYSGSGWKIETSTNIMQPGIGYIIRVPKPFAWPDPTASSYVQPVQFIGKPNNGNITSSQHMDKGKYYLIGNPYPSAIHADDFLFSNVNNRNILGGTIYFWTHNTAIKVVNSKLAYVSDDYASYNLTGGVATSAVSDPGYNDNPSLDTGRKPTGYIAAGQSFFTMAEDGSGYVEFNNSMRYGGTNNSQFFKPGKTSKSASIEKHRLWLNLSNTGGAFKQTLIGYVDGATNGYDTNFDGMTYDGNSYIDFYSVNETSRLTIQGRALPFSDSDVVPLGYRSTIAGDFTIAIDQADGNLSTQRIYLEDKQTGTINELTAKNYTFTTKAGAFNNRFVLRYKNATLGTGDFETVDDAVWVVAQSKTITVNSTTENIDKVFIYDVSGKELYSKDKVGNLELILQNQPFAQQVLLIKVVLENGYQTTKKVIFK